MALTLLSANNASTVLSAGISASATTLTVNTGTGGLFPSPVSGTSFFKLTLIDAATGTLTEIVHVTARTGDTMTIVRGQEGTVSRLWSANDIAANMMTAGTLDLFAQSGTLGGAALLNVGTTAGTVAAGNDSRIAGALQKSANLSDLTSVTTALANLGLGDVVRYGTFGTLPSGAMTVLPGGDFNLAPSGWCAASAATVNAPYNPINGTIFTWGSAGASSTGLLVPPSVGVSGQKWYQVLFDEAQAIYTRQRIGTGAWTDWQQIAHPKYFFVYPDGTSASPYVYPVNTRKEYTNPFPGKYLNVVAEVQVSGIWGAVPYVFAESSLQGIGIQATQINGNGNIVVQSGTNKVAFRSLYQGNPFGITADVGASPFRLKISNVGDL
ncbi:TPA: hypothetical protein P0O00_001713 [Yersinia enterocolitica]|nr:hypothetical protein [Yersinia enterocolitica]